jgi:hypothetical protein
VITYNPTEGSINTGDDLSPYIPAPVEGKSPASNFYAGSYGGTIVWETGGVPMTGAFQANTAYTAKVTLYAMEGYTLAGKTLTCMEGTLNNTAEWNNNGLTITGIRIDFPASSGTSPGPLDLDLTFKIPAPGMGGTPVTWFSTPRYTGNVVWTLNTGGPHSGLFAAYEAYTATVTLTAASGYSLTGGTFTHMRGTLNGANEWSNTGSTITGMRIAFPVTNVDLTAKISAPVAGGTPGTSCAAVQFTGNVDWACTGDAGWTSNMTFQASRTYTATVTLTPGSGYTLDGLGPTGFTCTGASSVTYITGSPMVFIAFPAASSTPLVPVSDLDLTSKVNAPAVGGTPGTNFTGSSTRGM